MSTPSNTDDVIDSRDVISRIEELKAEIAELEEELKPLEALANEGISDWEFGATLVADDYFEEYAKQLAEDVGCVTDNATWPNTCIDWEQAANELKQDYTSIDFDGNTYWVRS